MTQESVPQKPNTENQQLYLKYREELYKSILSNAENLDRTLITLSSAGLAISLTLVDKLVPLSKACFTWILFLSWLGFILSVVFVIVSYLLGQKAIRIQLGYAEEFYLNGKEEFSKKENALYCYCELSTLASSISFVVGLIAMILFAVINLNMGVNMSDQKTTSVPLHESAPILPMPRIASSPDNNRAAPILPMAPVPVASSSIPVPPPPASTAAPAPSSATSPVVAPASTPKP